MTLAFPNPSRSFDEAHRQIRFTGHDGMFEVPFLIDVEALSRGSARAAGEAEWLAAFDAARGAIEKLARKAYAGGRKRIYVLDSADVQ